MRTCSQTGSTSGNSAPTNPPTSNVLSSTSSDIQILLNWGNTPQGEAYLEAHPTGGQAEFLEVARRKLAACELAACELAAQQTSVAQSDSGNRPQTPPSTQPVAGPSTNIDPPPQTKRHFYMDLTADSPDPPIEPAVPNTPCPPPPVAAPRRHAAKSTESNTADDSAKHRDCDNQPVRVEMHNRADTRVVLTAANVSLEITHFKLETPTKNKKRKAPANDSDEDIENRPVDRKGKQHAKQKRAHYTADDSPTPRGRSRSMRSAEGLD
ncbi:hypothetical protein NP233_g10900 [Leucocoprinus birnbaumii]|uniref:Uncharacterized protein n=1 Tax=Leucocoprinus birnbaumii TaxID=56174 RepID=A0AAD5YLR7_9AGAR|nr:hypothetical protein NP233_g10900 [Leucocoprinus birnbaumii]